MATSTAPTRTTISFPIGYHHLREDVSVNFQLNRFYSWVGDPAMLDEMRTVSAGVSDYPTFQRIFIDLGEKYWLRVKRSKALPTFAWPNAFFLLMMSGNNPSGSLDLDFPDPAAEVRLIAEKLTHVANKQVQMVEGAGHYPHAEKLDQVLAVLLPFLHSLKGDKR